MRLHHTAMTLMVAGVLSLITTPVPADAQRRESDSERAYTVEGISCALFPEDCQPEGRTRGLPQRPGSEKGHRQSRVNRILSYF